MDKKRSSPTSHSHGAKNSCSTQSTRKGVSTSLDEYEDKIRVILDYTYNLEYWLSPEGECLYMSPSCQDITGYTVEEFQNNPNLLVDITHPHDQAFFQDHIDNQFQCDHQVHLTFRIITKSGELRWIAHSCQPAYDSQGKFVGRRASDRNISHRKKAEELLSKSEKRFRQALDASSDGVWDRNLVTKEVFHGDNWHRGLGYSDEEAPELTWESLIHEDDKLKTLRQVREHLLGNTDRFEAEFRLRNKSGNWQWVLSRGQIIEWDNKGNPTRITGTQTDITRLKEMEEDLQKARDELEQRVEARTAELTETNIALKVLLEKRNQDKMILEQQILSNVKGLIDPYVEQLKSSPLNRGQKVLLEILEANLAELTSPFISTLSSQFIKLTPAEIKVANLVKQGQRSKDIAELLNLSPGTIAIYRKNIRKKLGLTNKKANLQSILSSCSDPFPRNGLQSNQHS